MNYKNKRGINGQLRKNSSIGNILSGNSVDASKHSSTTTSGTLDVK